MSPPKPRRYDGPVDWLDRARIRVETEWSDLELEAVVSRFPYPPERGVRLMDWVLLVAHVHQNTGETSETCAERLALYCRTYAERYNTKLPKPDTIERTQP